MAENLPQNGGNGSSGPPSKREPWRDAHARALRERRESYIDPETGYVVFTELSHRARGSCCGSGCRHCPYGNSPLDPA